MTDELETKIIDALEGEKLDALQIAKKVIGPNATRKMVNPTLYRMHKANKLVLHIPEEGTSRPYWTVKQD